MQTFSRLLQSISMSKRLDLPYRTVFCLQNLNGHICGRSLRQRRCKGIPQCMASRVVRPSPLRTITPTRVDGVFVAVRLVKPGFHIIVSDVRIVSVVPCCRQAIAGNSGDSYAVRFPHMNSTFGLLDDEAEINSYFFLKELLVFGCYIFIVITVCRIICSF